MATKSLNLSVLGALLDTTNPPGIEIASGIYRLLFDDSSQEYCFWQFNMPGDYVSSPVFKFTFSMASATSGNVVCEIDVKAVTENTEDIDSAAYGSTNSITQAVAGTGGYTTQASESLANDDSLAAHDFVQIRFSRNGGSGSDTATGDFELLDAKLEYSDA